MTAEQFEAAWRRGRRTFPGVAHVEVSPAYVEGWETRVDAIAFERARWLAIIDADLGRRGNWLRRVRIDELDAERWQLALVRFWIQAINDTPSVAAAAPA